MSGFIEPKKRIPIKLQTPLAHGYGLDFGDLQDNRLGFISHWQKKRLRWYILSYTVSIATWITLLTVIPLLFTVLFFGIVPIIANIWVGMVLTIFGGFWVWKLWAVWFDMRRGQVAELVGTARWVRRERRVRQTTGTDMVETTEFDYYVVIAGEKFSVTRAQMEAFERDVLYRVFVSPQSRQILSAEILQETKTDTERVEKSKLVWGADEVLAAAQTKKQQDEI